jgi:autophagy-related protein 2
MSYLSFVPWTLQKRLLRYLLSQFDFLETDDLDLENLGVTWGQRSVVELKNIGLKTQVRRLRLVWEEPGTNVRLW